MPSMNTASNSLLDLAKDRGLSSLTPFPTIMVLQESLSLGIGTFRLQCNGLSKESSQGMTSPFLILAGWLLKQ